MLREEEGHEKKNLGRLNCNQFAFVKCKAGRTRRPNYGDTRGLIALKNRKAGSQLSQPFSLITYKVNRIGTALLPAFIDEVFRAVRRH